MDPDLIYGSAVTKVVWTWMEKNSCWMFLTGFVCAAARPAEPGALWAPRQLKRRFLHHSPHLSQGSSTFHIQYILLPSCQSQKVSTFFSGKLVPVLKIEKKVSRRGYDL